MTFIKMPVRGKAELQFWVRAFQLEGDIEEVVRRLHEKEERKTAFAPIISEYECGSIKWVLLLGPTIDPLGLKDGVGTVWLTSGKEHFEMAVRERNKLADEIISEAERQGKFDEMIEMEPKKDV